MCRPKDTQKVCYIKHNTVHNMWSFMGQRPKPFYTVVLALWVDCVNTALLLHDTALRENMLWFLLWFAMTKTRCSVNHCAVHCQTLSSNCNKHIWGPTSHSSCITNSQFLSQIADFCCELAIYFLENSVKVPLKRLLHTSVAI